jgi:hypothetical protein
MAGKPALKEWVFAANRRRFVLDLGHEYRLESPSGHAKRGQRKLRV